MILKLIINFFIIGLVSFGGAYAAIPITREIVEREALISLEEFANMVAVAESTPGSFICNLATYIGSVNKGFLGGVLTTISAVMPAFIIMLIFSFCAKDIMNNENVKIVFSVIRPAILSLILVVGLEIIYENLYDLDIKKLAIFMILIIASLIYKKIFKKKLSSIKIIIISAILGIIIL